MITDDVEVILARLERAREAIQGIRPILLNHLQKKQRRYTETEKIYENYINSLKGRKVADEVPREGTETDPRLIVSEAIALLGKISSLIQANKAKIVLASRTEEAIQARAVRSCRAREASTDNDMSPEQNFYFLLADSDLGTLEKSSDSIEER